MPRIKLTDRPIQLNVRIPSSLAARVALTLFSEVEGKVPHGAWQGLLVQLLEEHLSRLALANPNQRDPK